MVGLPGILASGTLPSTRIYTGVLYKLVMSTFVNTLRMHAFSVVKLRDMVGISFSSRVCHYQWRSEGRGPDWVHAQPKAPCFAPLMLRDLVQSTCERLVYSRCPANTNDLAMPLATTLVLSGELAETKWLLDTHAWLILLDFRLSSSYSAADLHAVARTCKLDLPG